MKARGMALLETLWMSFFLMTALAASVVVGLRLDAASSLKDTARRALYFSSTKPFVMQAALGMAPTLTVDAARVNEYLNSMLERAESEVKSSYLSRHYVQAIAVTAPIDPVSGAWSGTFGQTFGPMIRSASGYTPQTLAESDLMRTFSAYAQMSQAGSGASLLAEPLAIKGHANYRDRALLVGIRLIASLDPIVPVTSWVGSSDKGEVSASNVIVLRGDVS